jgi:decaprenylphospho-beta-D-erythro-pentofuranosid-2-ulose 2-reductase
MKKKKIVIVGATSAMATHCARLWVQSPVDLTLIGRDPDRLARVQSDLQARSPETNITIRVTHFTDPNAISLLINGIASEAAIDIALIAHGSLGDQEESQTSLVACRDELEINAVSPVLFAEAFASAMERRGCGTLAVISSVAGDRGRKSNYVYGAAKGLVTRYVQGLQHRFAGSLINVVLIKPGPTETPMTASLAAKGMKLAPVEVVADGIVSAIERKKALAYLPAKWGVIMLVIRHLPNFIFNKMNI